MMENIEIKRVEKFERKQTNRLLRVGASLICYLITKPDNTQIGLSKSGNILQTFPDVTCFEKGRIIHRDFTPFDSLGKITFDEFIKDADINTIPKLYLRYSFIDKTYIKDEVPQKKAQEEPIQTIIEIDKDNITITTKEDIILGESINNDINNENLESIIDEIEEHREKLKNDEDELNKGFMTLNIDFEDYIIKDLKCPDDIFNSKSKKEFTFNSIENIDVTNFDVAKISMCDRNGVVYRLINIFIGTISKKKKYHIDCENFENIIT